jgi:hypothetical protein
VKYKVQIKKNRYNDGVDNWTDAEYWMHLGPNIELTVSANYLIEFRLLETIGCIQTGCSDIMGTPIYSNDFFILKNNQIGRYIYDRFMECGDITQALKMLSVVPVNYNPLLLGLKQHVDPNESPQIIDF